MIMADIYLSFDHPNSALAHNLKHDLELFTGLSVGLECDDDWEDADDELQEQLDQAKTLLMLATNHSNITAWIMGDGISAEDSKAGDKKKEHFPSTICFPQTIDFKRNYEHGVNDLLCMIAKERKMMGSQCTQEQTTKEEQRHHQQEEEYEGSRILPAEERQDDMQKRTPTFGSDLIESSERTEATTSSYDSLLQRLEALERRTQERRKKQAKRASTTRTRRILAS